MLQTIAFIPQTEKYRQILQPPDGEQEGALNPPDPVGIPFGLEFPADMTFFTSACRHLGQIGAGSLGDKISFSNRWLHFSHTNSKIGILYSFGAIFLFWPDLLFYRAKVKATTGKFPSPSPLFFKEGSR